MFQRMTVTMVAGLIVLSGCAHSLMRGTVAMKISDNEGHVCLGQDEVKTGDRVAFLVNQCTGGARNEGGGRCELVKTGEGEITQTLNNHYSVVKANPGTKINEGAIVEKL